MTTVNHAVIWGDFGEPLALVEPVKHERMPGHFTWRCIEHQTESGPFELVGDAFVDLGHHLTAEHR